VRVVGSLHTRSWVDRESGQKRFKTVVRAKDVLFLDVCEHTQDAAEAIEEPVEDLPISSDWRSLISHAMRSDPHGSGHFALGEIDR